jgi:hypothetical protein
MTLFDVEELIAYWNEHPPMHLLVGAYLGAGRHRHRFPPSTSSGRGSANSDPSGVLAELGPGFASGDVHAGLPGVVLDLAELRSAASGENRSASDATAGKK